MSHPPFPYTFRQFALLRDPGRDYPASPHRGEQLDWRRCPYPGPDLVRRFEIAEESWDLYGPDGPPIGTRVEWLQSGGLKEVIDVGERFAGTYGKEELGYIHLCGTERDARPSVIDRRIWWLFIRPWVESWKEREEGLMPQDWLERNMVLP